MSDTAKTITLCLAETADGVINPLRGPYRWREEDITKQVPTDGLPLLDYQRWDWSDFETSKGVYNFTALLNRITDAFNKGMKLFFHVRCMHEDHGDTTHYFPQYVIHWHRADGTPVMDWNSPDPDGFITRWQALFSAMAPAVEDLETRLGAKVVVGMRAGGYATWGEWSLSSSVNTEPGVPVCRGKADGLASDSVLKAMTDIERAAFPNYWFSQDVKASSYSIPVCYSLDKPVSTWHTNGLAGGGTDPVTNPWTDILDFDSNKNYSAIYAGMVNKWKSHFIHCEFFSPLKINRYDYAIVQLHQWHISAVGNGNLPAWTTLSLENQGWLKQIMLDAGYRFRMDGCTIFSPWPRGEYRDVVTRWTNLGSAPMYEDAITQFQIVPVGGGTPVYTFNSVVDFRTVMPREHPTDKSLNCYQAPPTYTITDSASIPADVLPGTYELRITLIHPMKKLNIANTGRQTDGSYKLGTFTII